MPLKIITPPDQFSADLPKADACVYIAPRSRQRFSSARRCAVGNAVLLRRKNTRAPYIIAASAPLYLGGLFGEAQNLRACCLRVLEIAEKRHFGSLLFSPLPRGTFTFPEEKARRILVSAIGEWLTKNDSDMEITLLSNTPAPERKAFSQLRSFLSERLDHIGQTHPAQDIFSDSSSSDRILLEDTGSFDAVRSSALTNTEAYSDACFDSDARFGGGYDCDVFYDDGSFADGESQPDGAFTAPPPVERTDFSSYPAKAKQSRASAKRPPSVKSFSDTVRRMKESEKADDRASGGSIIPFSAEMHRPSVRRLEDVVGQVGESFSQMLFRLIDQRGLTDPEVYKRADMDRRLCSKIRSNPNYQPAKGTVLALAVALELNLDQTADLLRRAGFALSPSSKSDLIVEFFIREKQFNIHEINEALFSFKQKLLGA